MNYKEQYNKLMIKAKLRNDLVSFEEHHIIPKCLGGTDRASNLVELTIKEHRIAHLLLTRIHNIREMAWAAKMMCNRTGKNVPRYVRKLLSLNDETKQKISLGLLGNKNGAGNLGLKRADTSKMSAAKLGTKLSPESIAKREATKTANNSHSGGRPVGYKVSEETKEKIKKANTGKIKDAAAKLNMSVSAKNRKLKDWDSMSDNTKARLYYQKDSRVPADWAPKLRK